MAGSGRLKGNRLDPLRRAIFRKPRPQRVRPVAESRLARLATRLQQVRTILTNGVGILVVVVVLWAAGRLARQDLIIVDPIAIPESLSTSGWTEEIAAARLIDELRWLRKSAQTQYQSREFLPATDSARIRGSVAGFDVDRVVEYFRQALGLEDIVVSGEIIDRPAGGFELRLRDSQGRVQFRRLSANQDRPLESVLREAAHAVMEELDCPVVAAYYFGRDLEAVRTIAHRCLTNGDGEDDALAQYWIGVAHRVRGEHAAALRRFRKAVAENPSLPNVWTESGKALAALGSIDEANQRFFVARVLLVAGCHLRDRGWSCNNLGLFYDDGSGVEVDHDRARGLYERACDGGYALGCSNLGNLYDDGRGVEMDHDRARALYEQACDGGNALGCSNLGNLYDDGSGVEVDHDRARALYEQACDVGNALGCNNLGSLYHRGRGVDVDHARARALYEQACDGGSALGCNNLGTL